MKKIFIAVISLFILSMGYCSAKDYTLNFDGNKYYLLYSVKNPDFGGYLNEYYKQGETYNIWSDMVAVHHFPNAYSPIDRIRDFKNYLSSMQIPSSLTFDDRHNSAMIDFVVITKDTMPVVLEFNIFKYEKSKKSGSVAVQYVKRYSATTTMQTEEIKKDFEKNRKKLIKKVKHFNIPEVVTEDIDKCISGAKVNSEGADKIKQVQTADTKETVLDTKQNAYNTVETKDAETQTETAIIPDKEPAISNDQKSEEKTVEKTAEKTETKTVPAEVKADVKPQEMVKEENVTKQVNTAKQETSSSPQKEQSVKKEAVSKEPVKQAKKKAAAKQSKKAAVVVEEAAPIPVAEEKSIQKKNATLKDNSTLKAEKPAVYNKNQDLNDEIKQIKMKQKEAAEAAKQKARDDKLKAENEIKELKTQRKLQEERAKEEAKAQKASLLQKEKEEKQAIKERLKNEKEARVSEKYRVKAEKKALKLQKKEADRQAILEQKEKIRQAKESIKQIKYRNKAETQKTKK